MREFHKLALLLALALLAAAPAASNPGALAPSGGIQLAGPGAAATSDLGGLAANAGRSALLSCQK